jgi:transposase-like protein
VIRSRAKLAFLTAHETEVGPSFKERGLRAPRLAVADGANGFWAALSAKHPEAAQQRCWLHKIRNVRGSDQQDRRARDFFI